MLGTSRKQANQQLALSVFVIAVEFSTHLRCSSLRWERDPQRSRRISTALSFKQDEVLTVGGAALPVSVQARRPGNRIAFLFRRFLISPSRVVRGGRDGRKPGGSGDQEKQPGQPSPRRSARHRIEACARRPRPPLVYLPPPARLFESARSPHDLRALIGSERFGSTEKRFPRSGSAVKP